MVQLVTYGRKGGPLTIAEMDGNWLKLETAADAGNSGLRIVDDVLDPVTGGLILTFSDQTTYGPIMFPQAKVEVGPEWSTGAFYEPAELFTHGPSLCVALQFHQAGESFDDDVAKGRVKVVYTPPDVPALPPKDGKLYGIRNEVYSEVPAVTGGGSGDGWIYHTVSLTPGPKANGLTYGQFVHPEATVFNPDVRVLVSSKAAVEGNAQVMVYCGQDILLGFKLDGSDATKLPGDYVVPANTPLDVKMFGGSPNLTDVFTIRLAVRPAA